MDKIIKNYEEPLAKPVTTRDFIKSLKHKRQMKKNIKNSNIDQNCGHDHSNDYLLMPPKEMDIMSFALVVDDIVVEIMNVQEILGKFLQKEPKFVLLDKEEHRPHLGWLYKDKTFLPFEEHIKDIRPTTRG